MSCGNEDAGPSNEELLQQFFTENNINPERTSTGLYYVIDVPGDSIMPTSTSTVVIDYHGYFLDGRVFDSSVDRGMPLEISLNNVISGWRQGVPLFGQGGSGSLYIPSGLAYGTQGTSNGSIPPNTPIAFDIQLIEVK